MAATHNKLDLSNSYSSTQYSSVCMMCHGYFLSVKQLFSNWVFSSCCFNITFSWNILTKTFSMQYYSIILFVQFYVRFTKTFRKAYKLCKNWIDRKHNHFMNLVFCDEFCFNTLQSHLANAFTLFISFFLNDLFYVVEVGF